jgi:uncharacterized protein YyaL (SSP411 family)
VIGPGLLAVWMAASVAPVPARNHLDRELSPYLRQHSADAIEWFPWGTAAFDAARTRRRPLLIFVGHSACQACQVLDQTIATDRGVSRAVNATTVAVRVDREERPDVEDALRAVTGRPAEGDSTPFLAMMDAEGWPRSEPYAGPVDTPETLRRWLGDAVTAGRGDRGASLDGAISAGATAGAKVPPFGRFRLLVAQAEGGDGESLRILAETLDRIVRGGIRDHVGGGFLHGSRDAAWQVPWFEKLLSENALLLRAYALAFGLTRNLVYRDAVQETAAFLLREMRDPTGTFLASIGVTTSQEREGRYYLWTRDEILATLGRERADEFLSVYRLEPPGVLQLVGSPFAGLGASRDVLRARRARRIRPALDDKVVASWNGLAIGALATSGARLRRGSDIEAARRAAQTILERLGPASGLRHYSVGSEGRGSASLADYAYLAEGLLDLHEATGEARWLEAAISLADGAVTRFWDVDRGGFFATDAQHLPLPVRLKTGRDGILPAPNGVMAAVLLRLGRRTGQDRFTQLGRKTLGAFAREDGAAGFDTIRAASRPWPASPTP